MQLSQKNNSYIQKNQPKKQNNTTLKNKSGIVFIMRLESLIDQLYGISRMYNYLMIRDKYSNAKYKFDGMHFRLKEY